jgi:hypothetical protein
MRREQQATGASAMDWLDRTAIGASFLCLLHCAGIPLLLAALPALSRVVTLPESFHLWVLGFAIPSSAIALLGARRAHGSNTLLVFGGFGLGLMISAATIFARTPAEAALTVAGGLCLAAAHLLNLRSRHGPRSDG